MKCRVYLGTHLPSWLGDAWVYEPLRARGLPLAVFLSGAIGIVADSVLFLLLAFGSLGFFTGQVIGKGWATAGATALVYWRNHK